MKRCRNPVRSFEDEHANSRTMKVYFFVISLKYTSIVLLIFLLCGVSRWGKIKSILSYGCRILSLLIRCNISLKRQIPTYIYWITSGFIIFPIKVSYCLNSEWGNKWTLMDSSVMFQIQLYFWSYSHYTELEVVFLCSWLNVHSNEKEFKGKL